MQFYRIVRFYMTGEPKVIQDGLTLKEAQEHCKNEDTHGEDWFDGYELE